MSFYKYCPAFGKYGRGFGRGFACGPVVLGIAAAGIGYLLYKNMQQKGQQQLPAATPVAPAVEK